MSTDLTPLRAVGHRVRVHTPTEDDLDTYRIAVQASTQRLREWNPVNPHDLAYHLRVQSAVHRTFLVRALEPDGDHDIVGKVNVTNVVRGRALAGSMGYDSYDPYAERGLFAEGLCLVIDLAFAPEPRGMGLHRIDASVQPGNVRSAGLLRRLGLRRRGTCPAYLWLADGDGEESWRDHVTYGVTREQWPAPTYAAHTPARPLVVLLAGELLATPGATTVGRALAQETGVPLLRAAAGPGAGDAAAAGGLGEALADAVTGAVVLTDLRPAELAPVLVGSGLAEGAVVADLASVCSARDVVRLALRARAGAGIDDPLVDPGPPRTR